MHRWTSLEKTFASLRGVARERAPLLCYNLCLFFFAAPIIIVAISFDSNFLHVHFVELKQKVKSEQCCAL